MPRFLTLLLALQLALAPMAQATTPTAAYGGSFGDAFKGSFINSVVALGLADAQTGIGDVFAREGSGGEGSLGHVLLHGLAGCVAAEAQGADCAAGAAGGIAGAIYAGMQKAPEIDAYGGDLDAYRAAYDTWRSDVMDRAQLVSLAAGYIFSGGKAENVSVGASVGTSAVANNYLYHEEAVLRARSRQELESCTSAPDSCSDQRIKELMGTIAALDSVDAARDLEYRNACTNDGALACLAARSRYIDAKASFMEANRALGDQGYLAEYGDIFADIQAEFQSGLATDRLAVEVGIQRGIEFTARNLESLGSGAAGGAVVATAYFGGAALAGCLANPVCRTEVSVAIAEAAAGDALGGATLVPVVVAGRVALIQGDTVVGFIDEATHTFSRSADVPYDPRAVREVLERAYGADGLVSSTVPPLNAPNVRLAGQHFQVNETTRVVFDNRGFPIFDNIAVFDTRFTATDYRLMSSDAQMRAATGVLRAELARNPNLRAQFDAEQLAAIQSGSIRVPRFTWHHHQDTGRMQLVPREIHTAVSHIGGSAMWVIGK